MEVVISSDIAAYAVQSGTVSSLVLAGFSGRDTRTGKNPRFEYADQEKAKALNTTLKTSLSNLLHCCPCHHNMRAQSSSMLLILTSAGPVLHQLLP